MYKEICYYCYSEEKDDLNIYKFNHERNKSIVSRSHIYIPQSDINGVRVYYKNAIRNPSNH